LVKKSAKRKGRKERRKGGYWIGKIFGGKTKEKVAIMGKSENHFFTK